MLAAALVREAAARELPVVVTSAGTQAGGGFPATSSTVEAARKLGLDLAAHGSTPLVPGAVHAADVVIGLERRHVQEVVVLDPSAFAKTYTAKEIVRRGEVVGPRVPPQEIGAWLASVHAGRRPTDLLGVSADDDVADPTGSNAIDHRSTAEALDALAIATLGLLFG
jgi:protein-tyrosine phosphatase